MIYIHNVYTDYLCEAWDKLGKPTGRSDILGMHLKIRNDLIDYIKREL